VLAIHTRAQHVVIVRNGRAGLLQRGIGEFRIEIGD
jgi:hypothetical protein